MQTEILEYLMTEKPRTLSVKLDMDVVESARIVAAYHPYKTMSDLLSEILRPILTRMEHEAVEDRAKRPRRAKGQKP